MIISWRNRSKIQTPEAILNESDHDTDPTTPNAGAARSALNTAVRFLAHRSHTRRELHQKLRARGFDGAVVNQVVIRCEELKYLDDDAFARAYVRQMAGRGYGARRIRMAMKGKGFDDRQIDEALCDADALANEVAIARDVLARKADTLSHLPDDRKKKEKLYRFLYSRGFSPSIIFDILNLPE